jgi:hypothetical protein
VSCRQVHTRGSCDEVSHQTDGTFVAARVPADLAHRLLDYRIDEGRRVMRAEGGV